MRPFLGSSQSNRQRLYYTVKGKWRDHLVKEEVEEIIAESRRNGTHLKSLSWHVQFLSFSSLHRLSLTVYASVIKVKGGQQLTAFISWLWARPRMHFSFWSSRSVIIVLWSMDAGEKGSGGNWPGKYIYGIVVHVTYVCFFVIIHSLAADKTSAHTLAHSRGRPPPQITICHSYLSITECFHIMFWHS